MHFVREFYGALNCIERPEPIADVLTILSLDKRN